ncbi:MAG: DUF2752 domain-containing protein [Cyclobacteriaceae bacterium]|nr:DUF2752 domain-containing protein [Cyclobacteriaceae bacterium]
MLSKLQILFRHVPPEAIMWTVALIALVFYQPGHQAHFTVCPLNNMGFDFCPGCGLGRSVAWLFKGEIIQSWRAHPLGIVAVIVLPYRIISLTIKSNKLYGKSN